MKDSDRVIWEWLILKHPESIGVKWDYYGGCFFKSKEKSINIDIGDVDLDSMEPLQSSMEREFSDTFSEPYNAEVIKGKLFLNNGNSYDVGFRVESKDMLNEIIDFMSENIDLKES